METLLPLVAAILWLILLVLPWRPWLTDQVLEPVCPNVGDLQEITVVIPARNEADVIGTTLRSLAQQGDRLKVVLVDDGSDDGTAEIVRGTEGIDLVIIDGKPLPADWSGKLWALQQGIVNVMTPYTLLLDADIALKPGMVAALLAKAKNDRRQFVSIMANLDMASWWDRLLMPAFIFFFKLLYPFRLANSANRRFHAAAGGCILLETALIDEIGGFGAIRGAIIDDCSLAKKIKGAGHRTWIGQSHSVVSLRCYAQLRPIWDMVARTAFTQLRYSLLLLCLCTSLMALMFWVPVLSLWASGGAWGCAIFGCVAMMVGYLPTLNYYKQSPFLACLMPLIASLYLAMTWTSAIRYWRGERSRWKNRVYAAD